MQNINLNNNYISQTSFKNKDNKNNYDILKQKLINNEIFEMRENTKQVNRTHNLFWGILSVLPQVLLCQGDNPEKFKRKDLIYPAAALAVVNTITKLLSYKKEHTKYKEKVIKNKLEKEKLPSDIFYLLLCPTITIIQQASDGKMKTKEAKIKAAFGMGLSVLIGCLLNFVKNRNIEACEEEIKNVHKQNNFEQEF